MVATLEKKQRTQERARENVELAKETLEKGVEAILDGESFKNYLSLVSRLHKYSANNLILILEQFPEASMVMGYGNKAGTTGWKALGRYVKKGESGIKILAPMKRNVEDKTTGEKTSIVSGFKVVSVFDVSQTEGDPLPENPVRIEALSGSRKASIAVLDALFRHAEDIGLRVFDQSSGHEKFQDNDKCFGVYDVMNRQVFLRPGMMVDQRCKTLLHEIVHDQLHNKDKLGYFSRSSAELEAEGTAYVVLSHFDLDTSQYSFGYLATWSLGNKDAFKAALASIQKTACELIEAIEAKLVEKGGD